MPIHIEPVDPDAEPLVLSDLTLDTDAYGNTPSAADDPVLGAVDTAVDELSPSENFREHMRETETLHESELQPADAQELMHNTPFTATLESGVPYPGAEYRYRPDADSEQSLVVERVTQKDESGHATVRISGTLQPLA